MPHVVFVPLTGFHVREEEMRELGMNLLGLKQRAGGDCGTTGIGAAHPGRPDARVLDVQLSRNPKIPETAEELS